MSFETNPRLTHLKVKIKSLAAEASIIRAEEDRLIEANRASRPRSRGDLDASYEWEHQVLAYFALRDHRKRDVGGEQRHSLLAYGFLRGRPYVAMEKRCRFDNHPDFARVRKLAKRFSSQWDDAEWAAWESAAEAGEESAVEAGEEPELLLLHAI